MYSIYIYIKFVSKILKFAIRIFVTYQIRIISLGRILSRTRDVNIARVQSHIHIDIDTRWQVISHVYAIIIEIYLVGIYITPSIETIIAGVRSTRITRSSRAIRSKSIKLKTCPSSKITIKMLIDIGSKSNTCFTIDFKIIITQKVNDRERVIVKICQKRIEEIV